MVAVIQWVDALLLFFSIFFLWSQNGLVIGSFTIIYMYKWVTWLFFLFFFDCLFWVHLSEACVDMIKNVVAVVTYVWKSVNTGVFGSRVEARVPGSGTLVGLEIREGWFTFALWLVCWGVRHVKVIRIVFDDLVSNFKKIYFSIIIHSQKIRPESFRLSHGTRHPKDYRRGRTLHPACSFFIATR